MADQHPKHRSTSKKASTSNNERTEIYVLRDLKEYLGESALIIFSVLLALFLTEVVNKLHEKQQTNELKENIKAELIKNKVAEEQQYVYQQGILNRIDSALNSVAIQQQLLADGRFNLKYLAPSGVIYHDLSRVAWQVAQSQNITTKIDFKLVEKLTNIYEQQDRIDKLEDKVGNLLLSYESRNPANIRQTLILLRDNYRGWAFDRAKALIADYDEAIKDME